jgi:rRNA-processing protein FCF1
LSRPDADRAPRPVVLLDANALFLPFTEGVDLVAEVRRWDDGARLAVPTSVRREVDRLHAQGVPLAGLAARLAADLPPVVAPGRGDDALFAVAVRGRAAVLTADRALRDRLVAAGVVVLVPRDRGRIEPFRRRSRAATVKSRPPLAGRPRRGRR